MTKTEIILFKTDGGREVFEHYLGDVCRKRMFKNPYRDDSIPSCHLIQRSGRYYFYDFGSSDWRGDCFWFVGRIFNLETPKDFPDVLRIIDRDLSLGIFSGEVVQSSTPVLDKPRTSSHVEDGGLSFEALYNDVFSESELAYWAGYGIHDDVLSRYQVRSVCSCQFTRPDGSTFSIKSTPQEPVYGYLLNRGEGIKLYRPQAKVRFLYAGKFPHPYVFGYEQLPRHDGKVFITGGEKDVMTLAAHGYSALCLNSETSSVPEDLVIELCGRFSSLIFLYDSDETGKRESERWCREYSGLYPVRRLTLPLTGFKGDKDVSDYFFSGYTRRDFELFMQEKGL